MKTDFAIKRREQTQGTVYLVGAGPGDAGLLTVRAARLLRRADIIIHDALIGPEILALASSDAKLVDVGKRCGGRRTRQAEINDVLLVAARDHRVVVRLKGGDPFLFARGGEEAAFLASHGVKFEIVPGVTAGIGASAYAGIPLTHRDLASSVTFVTGHEDPTRAGAHVDWDNLARSDGTLVIYMGLGRLGDIARRLIASGKNGTTPAAVIEWGTLGRQRTVTADLATIAEASIEADLAAPALVVVGDVVKMRDQLAWFDDLPLRGTRVVVARSRPQPSRIAAALRRLGAEVSQYPELRAAPVSDWEQVDAAISRLPAYDWLLFSSPAGVRHFWRRLNELGRDSRALGHARIASLGKSTTSALKRRGINPDVRTRTFDTDRVIEAMGGDAVLEMATVLFPREANLGSAVAEDLRERGARVDEVGVFNTVAVRTTGVSVFRDADVLVLPSSTAARLAAAELGDAGFAGQVVAIGPTTARVAEASGLRVGAIANRATVSSVVAAARRQLSRAEAPVQETASHTSL